MSTEEKILNAAKNVFVIKGMAGARMQDIADEAGINKALLHYYFRSKEKLFETIFSETGQRFIPEVNKLINSDLPLFEKIEGFCQKYIEMGLENPYLPLFVINEANKQDHDFVNKIWGSQKPDVGKLIEQIEFEVKAGNIKSVSAAQLLMNIMSLCVFPFLGKPIWQMLTGMDDLQFRHLIELRKKEVSKFIIDSIRK